MKTFFFTFCLQLCLILFSYAQQLEQEYRTIIPMDQEIVSGGYFVDPPKEFEGHPYFESKNFENGKITINGLTYSDVPLLYNIWKDEILTFQPIHKQKILIRADKIETFTLLFPTPKTFVRIADNPAYPHQGNGMYELAFAGKAQVLIKYRKLTKPKREVSIYSAEFYQKADYFLEKEGELIQVSSKKQAFRFLDLEKKAIKTMLRGNRLNFKADKKEYLIFLATTFNNALP
jgi:hypothetical protein